MSEGERRSFKLHQKGGTKAFTDKLYAMGAA